MYSIFFFRADYYIFIAIYYPEIYCEVKRKHEVQSYLRSSRLHKVHIRPPFIYSAASTRMHTFANSLQLPDNLSNIDCIIVACAPTFLCQLCSFHHFLFIINKKLWPRQGFVMEICMRSLAGQGSAYILCP